jgi:hypothetical protein
MAPRTPRPLRGQPVGPLLREGPEGGTGKGPATLKGAENDLKAVQGKGLPSSNVHWNAL